MEMAWSRRHADTPVLVVCVLRAPESLTRSSTGNQRLSRIFPSATHMPPSTHTHAHSTMIRKSIARSILAHQLSHRLYLSALCVPGWRGRGGLGRKDGRGRTRGGRRGHWVLG